MIRQFSRSFASATTSEPGGVHLMRRRRTFGLAAAGAAAALLLAACSSGGGSNGSGSGSNSSSSAAYGAGITRVVNQSTHKGGTLTFDWRSAPDSFDPGN